MPFASKAGEIDLSKMMLYLPFAYEASGKYVSVTESDVRNYPIWYFGSRTGSAFEAKFAGAPKRVKKRGAGIKVLEHETWLVETEGTRTFPWRVFILADAPARPTRCSSRLARRGTARGTRAASPSPRRATARSTRPSSVQASGRLKSSATRATRRRTRRGTYTKRERSRPSLLRGDVGYGSDAVMCEAESRGITYLFKIRRSTHVRRLFKSLADGAGWSDCGFGWQAIEVSLRLDGWARGRRVLFIRRPAEKRVEVAEPKRRRRKMTPSPKDGVVVPTVPGRLKQGESEFVKDFKGREWDYCALVTNDASMDVWPSPLGEFGCGYFR